MKKALWALPLLGAGIGATAVRKSTAHSGQRPDQRWLTVTVNRPAADVRPGGVLPPPLDKLADEIDVEVRPAPGDRGTELAARLKEAPSGASTSLTARLAGQDPRQEVRRALREAKALLETGEVPRPDAPPTARPTPGGRLIGLLDRRAAGEGVL
jgi:hypothetical protein